jgi:hypothetical protein
MLSVQWASAQTQQWREIHKVKKKETIYSICQKYEITIDELKAANPEMQNADYQLKKGTKINIPFHKKQEDKTVTPSQGQVASTQQARKENTAKSSIEDDVRSRAIRVGVMLPLHNKNNDGKRMVEYYRGILMACDSIKKLGISTDVYAWNLPEDGNPKEILENANAATCDLIIGPLYSKYVSELSAFVEKNDIMLLIPFSIKAPEIYTNRKIFQIYQEPEEQNTSTVRRFCEWFKDYHTIIVDCADPESTKGGFTSALRKQLEQMGMDYNLTSLKSTDDAFRKGFSSKKKNVVVLNTARSPELNATFGKLSSVAVNTPDLHISMFGYTEWMMYVTHQLENFYRFNVYMPTPYYTNLLSTATERLQQKYRWNFHEDMIQAFPRFALAGFDHAYFFLMGLHKYGKAFDGAAGRLGYPPVQTPLKFERIGNGGLINRAFMFVHYMPDHKIEAINY